MEFLQPASLDEAIAAKAGQPAAVPIAAAPTSWWRSTLTCGGRRAAGPEPRQRAHQWQCGERQVRIGAGVTYARIITELGGLLPGLAMAARTVGSPQIRNRGTVGGNLARRRPPATATRAAGRRGEVEVASVRGPRPIPAAEFFTGPKRNALAADELITAVLIPLAPGRSSSARSAPATRW